MRELANRLKKDKLLVWFDEWELKPGDSIPAKIGKGMEDSSVFGSEWAQSELGTSRFRELLIM